MAVINFYHLTDQDINRAAARLLEKVITSGQRAVVLCANDQHCQIINEYLWTFSPGSFLPHGMTPDPHSAHQPIWVTSKIENPNQADIVVTLQIDHAVDMTSFNKCLDLFDGLESSTLELARNRWKAYKNSGNELTYWQQDPQGQWVKQQN